MKKQPRISALFVATTIMAGIAIPQAAYSHGAVSWPISRQYQCYKEGGFWGSVENIPNSGCRASVKISQQYPFIQWNEVAANPNPRHDQAAIRRAVPDGLLCAAGDSKKKGLDEPQSAGWKLTPITTGKMELTWDATAPHNPARYTIYITKQGADFQNRALRWDDLEQIASGDMPQPIKTSSPQQYKIPVTIPAGRSGKAIIYSVWQREDTGNEGFFNCSDVQIQGSSGNDEDNTPPPDQVDEWLEEQPFVKPGYPTPAVGDKIRFRLLGGNNARGSEVVDSSVPITSGNASNYRWAEELANILNETGAKYLKVGIKNNGHIQFDPSESRIHENMVWVKDGRYTSSMTIISNDEKPVDKPDNVPGNVKTWPAGIGSYEPGKTVVKGKDGNLWRCRPFPQGAWCNINHPAYEPGGRAMASEESAQAWERNK